MAERPTEKVKVVRIDGDDYTIKSENGHEKTMTWFYSKDEMPPILGDVLEIPVPIWRELLIGGHWWFGPFGVFVKAAEVAIREAQSDSEMIKNFTTGMMYKASQTKPTDSN